MFRRHIGWSTKPNKTIWKELQGKENKKENQSKKWLSEMEYHVTYEVTLKINI